MYKVIKEFPGGPKVGTELDNYTTKDNRCFDPQYFPEYFKKVYDISKHTYKPIPDTLELKASAIHGLGIHTRKDIGRHQYVRYYIDKSKVLTHCKVSGMPTVRTPVGGFINHSDEPNCVLHWFDLTHSCNATLFTLRDIKAGEELTLDYSKHDCG